MSFKIEKIPFGEFEVIKIISLNGGDILTVCNYGATVTSYQYLQNGKITDILLPYHSPAELKQGEAAVNWIMAPYSNRMRDGLYTFNNQVYRLDDHSGKSHGLVKKQVFNLEEITQNQSEVIIKFSTEITSGMYAAYPFHIAVSVTYLFKQAALDITIEGSNRSRANVPFGCGWHPYFYFKENGINALKLFIPSDEVIKVDENLVPLHNNFIEKLSSDDTMYFADAANPEELSFKSLNACFTNLKYNESGHITAKLTDTEHKTSFSIYQQRGVFYAYIPENLRGEYRKAIALEPVEFMTDAFNRPELRDDILLAPGQKRSFNFGIIRESLH